MRAAALRARSGVGFIGAGDVSTLHASTLERLSATHELRGLWSMEGCPAVPDAAARAAELGCALYPSAEALVADDAIEAVFVLTNYETHLRYARMAMAAGKHALVEKPAAASEAEMAELAALARRHAVHCVPVHNYVHDAALVRMRERIEAGELGRAFGKLHGQKTSMKPPAAQP